MSRFAKRRPPCFVELLRMQRIQVKDALNATAPLDAILLQGWVRTRRDAKAFSFVRTQ